MDNASERPLQPGEIDGEYVGCFLLYVPDPDGGAPSYHSLATSRAELLSDCWNTFGQLRSMKMATLAAEMTPLEGLPPELATHAEAEMRQRHAADLAKIDGFLARLHDRVDIHLATDCQHSFFSLPGLNIYLCLGARRRQKVGERYVD
jgi:hypothetical protein